MRQVFYILLGAGMTCGTALALGLTLLRRLAIPLSRWEERLLGFVTGSALLSSIVFALASVKLARKGVLIAVTAAAILWATRSRPVSRLSLPALPRLWCWILGITLGAYGLLYFVNSLAPEMSPDGTAYHLAFVARYYRAHGFERISTNLYAALSQGVELLYLFAFAFGRHSAAAVVHFVFTLALAGLMVLYARRFGFGAAGVAAALFTFACPVVGMDGTTAYIDVAVACILFAVFYFMQLWRSSGRDGLLAPAALLAGFAYGAKYTAFVAVPYVIGMVIWTRRKAAFRPVLVVAALAAVMILPWVVKDWVLLGNPVAPFANRQFPNPYVHVSFEQAYAHYLRHYDLTSYGQLPLDVTIHGEKLSGLLGWLFVLTPVGLLALRDPQGRQILLAGAIFALPYLGNIGTRFLIPAVPFVSVAMALVLIRSQVLTLVLIAAHAVTSWPGVISLYCSQYAWRLNAMPVAAALRIEPEDTFLERSFPGYAVDRLIERLVPPGHKVFAFSQTAEAYTHREILVKYLSAPNEVLGDMMLTPLYADWQPSRSVEFRWAARPLRKLRAVQTGPGGGDQWSITELRVYDHGRELPRAPAWRLTAWPNPWDIQLAFDNDPVTRWKTWQPARPGMYAEVDFGGAESPDSARVIQTSDQASTAMRMEGMAADGRWEVLSGTARETLEPISVNLRAAATAELKSRGIDFVLVSPDDLKADDFLRNARLWGMTPVGERWGWRLFRIN